jgi:cell division protein FtsA
MPNNHICALDIGSSKIVACLAQIKKKQIINIFFESIPSKGVKRGVVCDSIELVNTITKVLKNLKNKSGINIKSVHANISGQDILTKHSRAIIPLAERGNKVITVSDIFKVNEQARILGSSLEEEIIHQIPFGYSIDSRSNILNPIGLYSHRLEVDLFLICGKLSSMQSLNRVINQAGYEIKGLFFSGLATSRIVFNRDFKEGLNLLCDIGSDVTELVFFFEGILKDIKILPVGGDDLSQQLAEELKIPFELAEDVKRSFGLIGDYGLTRENKEILIKKNNIYRPIQQKTITDLLTLKAQSICATIKEAVEKNTACDQINNFIVIGRTILTDGFIESLESSLGIPVKLGRIADPSIIPLLNKDNAMLSQQYLNYITPLGIVYEAMQEKRLAIQQPIHQPTKNPFSRAIDRAKEIYQEYF